MLNSPNLPSKNSTLNPTILKTWIEALQSGEYRKAKGTLKTDYNAFCALGVLVDLYKYEHNETWGEPFWGCIKVDKNGDYQPLPPDRILEWIGLNRRQAVLISKASDASETFEPLIKILKLDLANLERKDNTQPAASKQ